MSHPGETLDERVRRLMHFHPHQPVMFTDLSAFHEHCVEFAVAKFKAKTDNGKPLSFYIFARTDGTATLETPWEGPDEKVAVMHTVREAVAVDYGVRMLATINEVWIAKTDTTEEATAQQSFRQLRREYKQVRYMPGREDGLMVVSYARDGGSRTTRWVVKLKHNPANNRLLERDDVVPGKEDQMYGQHFGYFAPEREIPED